MLNQHDDREAVIAAVVEAMGSGSCLGLGMGSAAVARGVITRYWGVVEATLLRQGWATPAQRAVQEQLARAEAREARHVATLAQRDAQEQLEQAEERAARLVAALVVADEFLAQLRSDARECRAVTSAALAR